MLKPFADVFVVPYFPALTAGVAVELFGKRVKQASDGALRRVFFFFGFSIFRQNNFAAGIRRTPALPLIKIVGGGVVAAGI